MLLQRSGRSSLVADLPNVETPDFAGLVIERRWRRDPELMFLSGETLIAAELGRRYGIKVDDGRGK